MNYSEIFSTNINVPFFHFVIHKMWMKMKMIPFPLANSFKLEWLLFEMMDSFIRQAFPLHESFTYLAISK